MDRRASTKESRRASHAKAGGEAGRALIVEHLRKTYPGTVAVDDVSFTVEEGEIFGILGPNGAGKTTTVECAIGLQTPDSGAVRVMGFDPHVDRAQVHAIVGAQLQTSALQPRLRVGEILELYRSFCRDPAEVGELLDALGLRETARPSRACRRWPCGSWPTAWITMTPTAPCWTFPSRLHDGVAGHAGAPCAGRAAPHRPAGQAPIWLAQGARSPW